MRDDPTRTHEDAVSMLAVSAYGLQSRENGRSQNEEYQCPHHNTRRPLSNYLDPNLDP